MFWEMGIFWFGLRAFIKKPGVTQFNPLANN
jgi:hypothetical protein